MIFKADIPDYLGLARQQVASKQSRIITPDDHETIQALGMQRGRSFIYLDWREFKDWLASRELMVRVLRVDGTIIAMLGATLHPFPGADTRQIAWLRFIISPVSGEHSSLGVLWEALVCDLRNAGMREAVILSTEPWVQWLAKQWGFIHENTVVTMQRYSQSRRFPDSQPYTIRPVTTARDVANAAVIDTLAFDPPWRYSRQTLEIAGYSAAYFTLLESGKQVLGYQLSTEHDGRGHLARLAVLPEMQGQGLGRILVEDMIAYFARHGISVISVNTQENNTHSQRLYASLGFSYTGYNVPLWSVSLSCSK